MEEEREKYTSLNREDRYLEREKKRAEYEIESRNKKKQTKELERELEVCRNKCNELSVELEKKKMECVGFEAKLEELAQYKMMYNGIKQQMTCLEENQGVVCQSENKAQEWIAYLSKEMKKMERDDREKFPELEVKIRDLESGIRRVEGENEGLKRRFTELERELEVCRNKCNELSVELEEKKMECVGFDAKLEELAQYKMMYNGIKQQMTSLEENRRVVCQSENKAQLCIAYLSEEMKKMEKYSSEKSAEFEIKVRDLESGKRRVEDENEGLKRRFTELGVEFSMHKNGVQLERDDREKNAELEIKKHDKSGIYVLFKNDNREPEEYRRKIEETEIWKKKCYAYKITCKRLKEQSSEREKELKKMERDEKERYDQLKAENRNLEFEKRRGEDEIDVWKKRFEELETEAAVRGKHEVELEKELDVCRNKCDALSEELKKMERDEKEKYDQLKAENHDLQFEKRRAEAEFDNWKERFNELETQAAVRGKHEVELEKELDVYRTNCDALSKELKKMERDEKEKYDQLKAENHDLQFEKRRAEAEIDDWKKRFEELESRVLPGTTLICRESHVSGIIESEPGGLPTEVSHNDEKDDRNKTIKLQSKANGGDDNGALVVHVTGTPSIDMQSLPVVNVKEDLVLGKQLVLELDNEMQSVLKLGSIRPASCRIIDISDDSSDNSSVKEKDLAPKNCLKRLYSDQRGEIYGSRCDEDSPFTSSSKRKRASETPNASCGGLNVEEKNGWAEKTSPKEHTSLTQLDMSGKSNEKVGNHTAEEGKEKMEEEDYSDSEDGNLGGFKLEGSDSSDSGYSFSDSSDSDDSGNLHLVIDNALKKIFNRDNQSNLKVEADKGAHKLQDYR